MGLLRKLFYYLAVWLYELIPSLYDLFYKIVTINKNAKEVQVNEVTGQVTVTDILNVDKLSKNIYLLMAAIMLFAFAIRLLSSIVNPDNMFDKKKGVQALLMRAFIGIVLIGGIPLAFDKLYEFQQDILDRDLIARYVFGMNIEEDKENKVTIGHTIMAQSFSAFCYPANEGKTKTAIKESYYKIMNGDSSGFDKLGSYINDKDDGEYIIKFHSILSPVFAVFMDYQMILLCIDTALRTFKLMFLEILTPLVICACIFSEKDILHKWANMVFSTYLIVFTKIIGLYFLAYGLSLTDTLLGLGDSVEAGNWLERGLIHALLVIGLLQLVKQIPDILDKVFGIKIEDQGGIGSRLAGMAGVGNIAKSAWDKVKSVGGNVATKVGIGAGALAAAATPLGLGALAGAGAAFAGGKAIQHGWTKGFKNTGPWKDTATGRVLRSGGARAKAVGVGLASKGGIYSGIKAGRKAYEETEIAKQNLYEKREREQEAKSRRFKKGVNDAAGKTIITEDGSITNNNAIDGRMALLHAIENDNSLTKAQKQHAISLFNENAKLSTLNELKSQKEKIISEIERSQASLDTTAADYNLKYNKLEALKGHIANGTAKASEINSDINGLLSEGIITNLAANNMESSLNKIMNSIKFSNLDSDLKKQLFGENGNGNLNLSNGKLLGEIGDVNNRIASFKSNYDQSKENATANTKELLSMYEKYSDIINNKALFETQRPIKDSSGALKDGFDFKVSGSPLPTGSSGSPVISTPTGSSGSPVISTPTGSSSAPGVTSTIVNNQNGINQQDLVLKDYSAQGFEQNADGHYFNPYTDEFDESYDPRFDSNFLDQSMVMQEYSNDGYSKNADGHYFNPDKDEYDATYDPRKDSTYQRRAMESNKSNKTNSTTSSNTNSNTSSSTNNNNNSNNTNGNVNNSSNGTVGSGINDYDFLNNHLDNDNNN